MLATQKYKGYNIQLFNEVQQPNCNV